MAGVWVLLHRALDPLARLAAGRKSDPTVVIMDGQSVKTVEQGGVRGFDGGLPLAPFVFCVPSLGQGMKNRSNMKPTALLALEEAAGGSMPAGPHEPGCVATA
jgi:hypothetical protein